MEVFLGRSLGGVWVNWRLAVNKFFSFFDRGLTWADLLWRLVTFIIVLFGGTTAALLAKASELFKGSSPFVWLTIGIFSTLILSSVFCLINISRKQAANAKYLSLLSSPISTINPLMNTFEDKIIKLSDLQLPLNQIHKFKHFRRCKIVGPGTIAMLGGTYSNSGFINCGDIIMVPEHTFLTGVIGLDSCTIESCELIDITIITRSSPENIAAFKGLNSRIIVGEFR